MGTSLPTELNRLSAAVVAAFFDVLDADLLRAKPVLLAATAGSARHSLMSEHAMRPLFSYLGAAPFPLQYLPLPATGAQ